MDTIDENTLIELAISGGLTPRSVSEMDRLVRLEQEGYVEGVPGPPIAFALTAHGRAAVEAVMPEATITRDPSGFDLEVVITPIAGGGRLTSETILTADKLIQREMVRLEIECSEPDSDRQKLRLNASLNVWRSAGNAAIAVGRSEVDISRGHKEAIRNFLAHVDEKLAREFFVRKYGDQYSVRIEADVIEFDQKWWEFFRHTYLHLTELPDRAHYEGIHDGMRDGEEAIRKATIQSAERMGAHEWDIGGGKELSHQGRRVAVRGHKNATRTESLSEETTLSRAEASEPPAAEIAEIEFDNLARLLHLEPNDDVMILLRHYRDRFNPDVLTRETGQPWDSLRLRRARERLNRRWGDVKAAIEPCLLWRGSNNLIKLKTENIPSGTYTHTLLLKLFR